MKGLEKSFKEAALAIIAAENGVISPQKLVHIFSDWVNSPGVSIRKKLEAALPEENRALLDLLGGEEISETTDNNSIDVLIESVNRLKEQTKMAVSSTPVPTDNTSDRLITDETPGRYVMQGEMARGGAGRVMIALDRHIGREIAMKELLLDLQDKRDGVVRNDPQTVSLRNRFLREARVTGQLEHPSIVSVYEIGKHPDGVFYYTMRMVKGKTLSKAIRQSNSLEDRLELLPHFYNVCNAVAYAHSKGVINRDLKPSNVMIGEFGETVVLDWGLAKVKGQQDVGAEKIQSGLRLFLDADVGKTVVGYAIGTPSYMPPEQAEGKVDDIDEQSDIYSLGAILYQIITGSPPYNGKTASEILRQVVDKDVPKACSVDPDIPPELSAIAHKAMAKKKKERYSSATELIDELNNYMSGGQVKVYEYSSMEILKKFASKNKAVFISSILIFFMLALSTLMIAWYYDREVTAKKTAQKEKLVSQYRTAQAFNEKAARLESQKQFLSSRIYAAASLYFNPANRKSPEYVPWFRKNFKAADILLSDAGSRFYQRHFHRGAVLENGIDLDCPVSSMKITPDNSNIIAGCINGEVKIIDLSTLKENKSFKTGSQVTGIVFSPSGKEAFISGAAGILTETDKEGDQPVVLTKKGQGFKCLDISNDGKKIAACGIDELIKLYDTEGNEIQVLKGHAGIVNDVQFVDDGTLVSASSDGSVKMWNSESGDIVAEYVSSEEILKMAVSRKKDFIITGSENGTLTILSTSGLRFMRKLSHHKSQITSISVSNDGSLFIISEKERKSVIWDSRKMIPLFTVEGHRNNINAAQFYDNDKKIVTAGTDGFIRIWKRQDRLEIKNYTFDTSKIRAAAISNGGIVAVLPETTKVVVENPNEKKKIEINLESSAFDVDVSPDGKTVATAGWDTFVKLFDTSTGKMIQTFKGNENAVSSVRFSNNGKFLISSGRDGSIRLFSIENPDQTEVFKCSEGGASTAVFSFDDNLITGVCDNGDVPVLKTRSLEIVKNIKNKLKKPVSVSFLPDNNSVLISYSFHSPDIMSINSNDIISFSGQYGSVIGSSVSKEGRFAATSSTDSLVQIWDMAEHKPFLNISTQKDPACLFFVPGKNSLAVCDGGTIKFYPLETPDLEMNPFDLLKKMEREAGMKLKDFYLEAEM